MQFKPRFAFLASVLATVCTLSAALSIQIDSRGDVTHEFFARQRATASFTYHGESAALMSPDDVELVRRAAWTYNKGGQTLLMGVIVTNGSVAAASCNTGNPAVCAIGVGYSLLSFFFAAYLFADRSDMVTSNVYFVYPATAGKTVRQRLMTELEPGKWHDIGHAQHLGNNHTVQYFNGGTYHQLRATSVPLTTSDVTAREEASDGGFVGDMYWNSNNEQAYDDFHSTDDSTSFFASNSGAWMVETSHAIAACSAFDDGDGILDNGIMTLGWNNQPFEWEDGEMEAAFGTCQGQL